MSRVSRVSIIVATAILLISLPEGMNAQGQPQCSQPQEQTGQPVKTVVNNINDLREFGWGWTWYDPFPWGWGYPYVYPYQPYFGAIRIEHIVKDTLVYVDGGYAGTAGQVKKFRILPGNHDIELRNSSGQILTKKSVHVLPGKTVAVRGDH